MVREATLWRWRTVIDKDHNNKVDMAEFFVVLYMWRSRGLGSYRKLFQYNSQVWARRGWFGPSLQGLLVYKHSV